MNKGFTLLELLIVIGAATIIAALTVPIGIRFFQTQRLDEEVDSILVTIRLAQNQAIFQENDSAFGLKFLSGSYVLFQGISYASRTQSEDETFVLSNGITTSGIDEVVFSKRTGLPSITPGGASILTITFGNDSQRLSINAQGKIERE